jgi:hypothetical protein
MRLRALDGEPVFDENAFDMDERTAAIAVLEVVQRGERKRVLGGCFPLSWF